MAKETDDERQNMTITTYPADRAVLAEIVEILGPVGPSEIMRRALRCFRGQLLEEAAREADLRARASGGQGSAP